MTHALIPPRPCRGFTLIELCIATAMGAMVLSALVHVARLATQSRAELRDDSELRAESAFVAQRLHAAARAASIQALLPPGDGDTGQWLAPKRFCINSIQALVETTVDDTDCSQGEAIAERVQRLTVSQLDTQSALEAPLVLITAELSPADGSSPRVLSQTVRLKGLRE